MSDLVDALEQSLRDPTPHSFEEVTRIVRERFVRSLSKFQTLSAADHEGIANDKALGVTAHLHAMNDPKAADGYVARAGERAGSSAVRDQAMRASVLRLKSRGLLRRAQSGSSGALRHARSQDRRRPSTDMSRGGKGDAGALERVLRAERPKTA